MKPEIGKCFHLFLSAWLILGLGFTTGCHRTQAPRQENPPVYVQTTTIGAEDSQNYFLFSGNVEAKETVRLGFMISGKIASIRVKEGDQIKKGQLIATIDASRYKLGAEISGAQLNEAKDQYKRATLMHNRGSLNASDYFKIGTGLQEADAQNGLQVKNIYDSYLRAPINGIIQVKAAEAGEVVSPGMPIVVISDIETIKINMAVPESELKGLRVGQITEVYINALGRNFSGKITQIGLAADPETRAFSVKVSIKNTDNLIKPGMTAQVSLKDNQIGPPMITLPMDCIMQDADNTSYVYVADPNGKKAFKRQVALGKIINNNIEILSGLRNGERVITEGQQKIQDGTRIAIK